MWILIHATCVNLTLNALYASIAHWLQFNHPCNPKTPTIATIIPTCLHTVRRSKPFTLQSHWLPSIRSKKDVCTSRKPHAFWNIHLTKTTTPASVRVATFSDQRSISTIAISTWDHEAGGCPKWGNLWEIRAGIVHLPPDLLCVYIYIHFYISIYKPKKKNINININIYICSKALCDPHWWFKSAQLSQLFDP